MGKVTALDDDFLCSQTMQKLVCVFSALFVFNLSSGQLLGFWNVWSQYICEGKKVFL